MATLKRQRADGSWEYIQLTGEDLKELKQQIEAMEQSQQEVVTHLTDNNIHLQEGERETWNNKANVNHNHDGIYEPILPEDRKRKISFGTSEPSGGSNGDIYFQHD